MLVVAELSKATCNSKIEVLYVHTLVYIVRSWIGKIKQPTSANYIFVSCIVTLIPLLAHMHRMNIFW